MAEPDAAVPEIDHLDEILRLAESDLDAARSSVGRVIGTRDALRAAGTTLTLASLGLAVANDEPDIAVLAVPLILLLGLGEARQEIALNHVTDEARRSEKVVDGYFKVLREVGDERLIEVERLRGRIDQYEFGIERTLRRAKFSQYARATIGRPVWYLFVLLVALLIGAGVYLNRGTKTDDVCLDTGRREVRVAELPEVEDGELVVIPCDDD